MKPKDGETSSNILLNDTAFRVGVFLQNLRTCMQVWSCPWKKILVEVIIQKHVVKILLCMLFFLRYLDRSY